MRGHNTSSRGKLEGRTKKFRFVVCYRLGSDQNPNNDAIRFKPENLSALILFSVVHSQRAMPQPPCTTNQYSTVFALVWFYFLWLHSVMIAST